MPTPGPVKVLDTLSGTSWLAIEAALKTLGRHRLDPAGREIVVVRDGGTTVVLLSGAEGATGARVAPDEELGPADLARLASARERLPVEDSIQGSSLPAMRVGVDVFSKRVPDVTPYRIALMRQGDSLVVVFTDRDAPSGGRGSRGGRPGFEVEMAARDLALRRSSFVR